MTTSPLHFHDNELRYRHHFLRDDARSFASLVVLFLLFQLMLIKADEVLGLPAPAFNSLLALRIALVLLSAAVIVVCLRTNSPDRFDRWCFVWGMVIVLTNNLVILSRPSSYTGNMIVEPVLIFALYATFPGRTVYRTLPPVLCSLGSLILFFTVKAPVGMVTTLSIVVAYLVANLLSYRLSSNSFRYRRSSFFNSEALEQDRITADASNKAKSDFLALVSHEIRTPLNALIGFSTLAKQTTDPGQRIEYLAILEESSRTLMDLVNNILDMSRIESGQLNLEMFPFNLPELIARITGQHAPLATQKGLDFKVSSAEDIPQWVIGDPLRLQQILTNLISNAIKFTQTGGVSCSAGMAQPQQGDGDLSLQFAVQDSGIGIPENKLPLLFQPFHQLSPGITRRYGGSGLGLAIVQRLLTRMDGRIDVASHEGKGTCFTVILPLQQVTTLPMPLCPDVFVTKQMGILVVEDNAFNRRLLTDTLLAWGHVVTQAENGRQALALKLQNDYDLVVLDIRMPDMDGVELARQLRRMEPGSHAAPVPIIAITADTLESTRRKCLDAGINAVLFKPLDPVLLALEMAKQCRVPDRSGEGSCGCLLAPSTMADMGYDAGQMATYQSLLLNDIADELDRMDQAIANYDRAAAGDAAHTLKGLCGHLSEQIPKNLAIRLHHHAAVSPFQQLFDMATALRASCTPFPEMNLHLEKPQ